MIAKRFSNISAGVLLEKVIRKNYEMFWHKTSMRKPFFSKATYAVQPEKNFPIHFFLKISKNVQNKNTKTFRKIINRAYFDEDFYKYVLKVDKTYLQISFKTIIFKCSELKAESFVRYISFCPCLI